MSIDCFLFLFKILINFFFKRTIPANENPFPSNNAPLPACAKSSNPPVPVNTTNDYLWYGSGVFAISFSPSKSVDEGINSKLLLQF